MWLAYCERKHQSVRTCCGALYVSPLLLQTDNQISSHTSVLTHPVGYKWLHALQHDTLYDKLGRAQNIHTPTHVITLSVWSPAIYMRHQTRAVSRSWWEIVTRTHTQSGVPNIFSRCITIHVSVWFGLYISAH